MTKKSIKVATIILKPSRVAEYYNILPNLCRWLTRRKVAVQFLEKEQGRVSKFLKKAPQIKLDFVPDTKVFDQSDLIISMGGDGTLIGTSRFAKNISTPIFGVNLGHLGFITEFQKKDFYDSLDLYLKGKLETEKLNLFQASFHLKDKKIEKHIFLNDIVFSKSQIARMFTLTVESEEGSIFNLTGDGLIISTPIGSTAYSLAAGGPIVHPAVRAMILTPICPHGLTNRPLVLTENEEIKIFGKDNESIQITLDGQRNFELGPRDYIKVKKSRRFITLVKNPDKNYFNTLKDKFFHGRREGVK